MTDQTIIRKKGCHSLKERYWRWMQLVTDMEREDWPYELEDLTKDHEPEIKRYRMGEGE